MAEKAAHLVDRVFPEVPVRQWVLSLPHRILPSARHIRSREASAPARQDSPPPAGKETMPITLRGHLHTITNLQAFLQSYGGPTGPTTGFRDLGRVRVVLATNFPEGRFEGGFLPRMSYDTDSNGAGEFSFSVPDVFRSFEGRIVVYRQVQRTIGIPGMPPIPYLVPIYRSEPFAFEDVPSAGEVRDIYVSEQATPDALGLSQDDLRGRLDGVRNELGLDNLRATIHGDRIGIHATQQGARVSLSARVRGSTSHDLTELVRVKVEDIDIDLPGPDLIVGLCVDKGEIERRIQRSEDLTLLVNVMLLRALSEQTLPSFVTFSVWRTRFPVTDTQRISIPALNRTLTIPRRSVVPDIAVGIPRQLY